MKRADFEGGVVAKKRQKGRRAPSTRRKQGGRGSTGDMLQDVFRALMRSATELTEIDDPLDAEMFVSQVVSMWEDAYLVDADAEEILGLGAVGRAQGEASERGLALLVGLEALGGPRVAHRAAIGAGKLAAAGLDAPGWAGAIGRVTFVEAWVAEHELGDGDMVGMVFRHEDREPHALGVLIDHNLSSMAKDVLVSSDAGELRKAWEENPEITIREIDEQDVATRLATGLEMEEMFLDGPSTEEFMHARALLRSRLRCLPEPKPLPRPVMDEAERERLEHEFRGSPEARTLDRDAIDDVVWRVISFSCDYGCGDPLRWSPVVVELFMTEWLPRKALLDGPAERVPDVLRAWVRFAGRKRGVSKASIADAADAVVRWENEMLGSMGDPSSHGPAKAIISAMTTEGIDLTDQAAVNVWLDDFNSRPGGARRAVLG